MDVTFTELQLEIMTVLWRRGEATAADIRQALRGDHALRTVLTILRRLEGRKVVAHRSVGRQFIYRARVNEADVKRSVIGRVAALADTLFEGDRTELVTHLFSARDVDAEDLARLKKMIEQKEKQLQADP